MIYMNDVKHSSDIAISLDRIHVTYGHESVLNDMSFQFEKGKTYTLIGPSGCGKTTLLYAIAGLLPLNSGTVTFSSTITRDHLAVVLQEYGLFPWKTVWQNILLGLQIKSKKISAEQERSALEISKNLGLEAMLKKYPHQLSGGQKQRVAIARSWLLSPEIMLMDEPFSALDTMTRETLQNTIIDLHALRPITWITVTHNIEEAVYLGQEILLMSQNGGQVIRRIPNPWFGSPNFRTEAAYYDLCRQVRLTMQEVYDAGGAR